VIRTGDDSVVARVLVIGAPTGIAVKPGGEYVYVASEAGGSITWVGKARVTPRCCPVANVST